MVKKTWFFIGLLFILACIETAVPYIRAEHYADKDHVFLGQIIYTPDQDMYFSFLSQVRHGGYIFYNKYTGIPNAPSFFNVEFLLAGLAGKAGLSENATYYVWRFFGAWVLVLGFVMLARAMLPERKIVPATAVFLFTGGSGFLFLVLNSLHLINDSLFHAGILDMRYGFLPLQQMFSNPHFSFPHGLILISYAIFLHGLQRNSQRLLAVSGICFSLVGLVRPYDLIPLPFILPVAVLIFYPLRGGIGPICRKLLPLWMIGPVFLYNVWLFKFNEFFKYWASQGHNADSLPSIWWHYPCYGIIGILAVVRLLQVRRNPLSQMEQFMVAWFGITFTFIHLGKYIPAIGFSPQIGVYLAAPLTLLSFGIRVPDSFARKALYKTMVAIVVLLVVVSNLALLAYFNKNFAPGKHNMTYYADSDEMKAWEWMDTHLHKGDVVLASLMTSLRIGKYTCASVVGAHYSVTPRFDETLKRMDSVGIMPLNGGREAVVQRLNADYLYSGLVERLSGAPLPDSISWLTTVYTNPYVTIYKMKRPGNKKLVAE